MGDNRDKDKEASKNLNSEAESDILKKIDLAFQVVDKDKATWKLKLQSLKSLLDIFHSPCMAIFIPQLRHVITKTL